MLRRKPHKGRNEYATLFSGRHVGASATPGCPDDRSGQPGGYCDRSFLFPNDIRRSAEGIRKVDRIRQVDRFRNADRPAIR
jgi:hypothetical protein